MACYLSPVILRFGLKRKAFIALNFNYAVNQCKPNPVRYLSNENWSQNHNSSGQGAKSHTMGGQPSYLVKVSALATLAGIAYFLHKKVKSWTVVLADTPTHIKPSRSIVNKEDNTGLKLILYQYQTCPFCCKVRAYLDFLGLSYDIVEVNPVSRKQIKFSRWRKVPIVIINDGKSEEQLNDSSMIISFLQSYLLNHKQNLDELITFYPLITYEDDDKKTINEILNRYSIMYGEKPKKKRKDEEIDEERKWRKWADNKMVHTLSPNVYRTPGEALQAFQWFSEVGEWEKNFPVWERLMVIYVGATAMYFIGKRLKKRHSLKDDVRLSLYDACNEWTKAVRSKGKFMGGNSPNLADLAVYGVLSAIEGCAAFQDLLDNTKIEPWFAQMKEVVGQHAGLREIGH